jgi:AAA domain-containing protein
MKKDLVKTSNYERFRTAVTAVEQRGAPEASMLLVVGDPGFSKSIIVNRWAVDSKAVYLRAKVGWTPPRFQKELAAALGVDRSGRADEVFARIVAVIGKQELPLVIDEVQHTLHDRARTLEAIRDISDVTETIVVLVAGEERVQDRIGLFPQLASRIAKVVDFQAATVEDVKRCCEELCEVEIAADLAVEIHKQSGGRMRSVINAIALVERAAKRNGQKKAHAADFAGKALVYDWQSRRPRGRAS